MATSYKSPGVYVEEIPSAVKAIAGVSTSTAGFIGIVPNTLVIPVESVTDRLLAPGMRQKPTFDLPPPPVTVLTATGSFQIRVNGPAGRAPRWPTQRARIRHDSDARVGPRQRGADYR